MKIKEIKMNALINIGPYSHVTLDVTAEVNQGEDVLSMFMDFKKKAAHILANPKEAMEFSIEPTKVEEIIPEVTVPAVKEKKTRAKKEIVEEVTVEAVIPEKKESPSLPYNRDLDTHRQLLSSFLNKNHPSWKTAEGVKEFSMGLVGKPFLNADGAVVESFAKLLSDFFNA